MKEGRQSKEGRPSLRPLELERHQATVDERARRALSLRASVPDAPAFRPTAEEFRDPIAYIRKIQPLVAPEYGICRIIPPVGAAVPAAAVLAACAAGETARAQAAWAGAAGASGRRGAAEAAEAAAARRPGPVRFTVRTQDLVAAAAPWRSFLEARTFVQHPGTFTLQSFEALAAEAAGRALGTSAPLPPLQVEAEYWRVHEEGRRARAAAVPASAVAAGVAAEAAAAARRERRRGPLRPTSSGKKRRLAGEGGSGAAAAPPPPAEQQQEHEQQEQQEQEQQQQEQRAPSPPLPLPPAAPEAAGLSDRRAGAGSSSGRSGGDNNNNDGNGNGNGGGEGHHRPRRSASLPPPPTLPLPREAAGLIRDARAREALMLSGPRPRQKPVEYWRMGAAQAGGGKEPAEDGGEVEEEAEAAQAVAAAYVTPQRDAARRGGGEGDDAGGTGNAKRKRPADDQHDQQQQQQQEEAPPPAPAALQPPPPPQPPAPPPPPPSTSTILATATTTSSSSRRPGPLPQPVLVHYGNDVEGTAFSDAPGDPLARSAWNLNHLARATGSPLALLGPSVVPGVNRPMLYVGMALASFAWHVEDQWLYSINYHHFGAPKTWYGAPAADAELLERAVAGLVGGGAGGGRGAAATGAAATTTTAAIHDPAAPYAPAAAALMSRARAAAAAAGLPRAAADAVALRAVADASAAALATKTTLACPVRLRAAGVRVCRAVHRAGEFIVTFPRAYHGGFSHGLNVGEAVNFCTRDWHAWAEGAAELAGRRLGRAAILPHERMLAREARRIAREVEAYERVVGGVAEAGEEGREQEGLPPHPLDPRPVVVPSPALEGGEGGGGGSCSAPSPATPPLLVPQSAAWSAARCFLRMMRRLRAARAEAEARGMAEVVAGGEGGAAAAAALLAAAEAAEDKCAPAQPSPACARCGSACFGVVAMGQIDDGAPYALQEEEQEEEEEEQPHASPPPPPPPPPPSPLCARCVLAEPRCRGARWAIVVDAEVPALDALARRWERGELGGRWLLRPGEAVAGGVAVGVGVGGVVVMAAGDGASIGRGRGACGGGGSRSASPADAAADDDAAAASLSDLFLHETGLGPGLPSCAEAAWGAEASAPSPALPGDVPAAWLALLRAPSGVAVAPIARRMATGT